MLEGYIVSYAQNREDIIINAFFPNVTDGFYVDVGANDPEDDSVTKIFYDKGWRGINIEPSPMMYQKLIKARKRDINVNLGVSDSDATLEFREYINHGLSTFAGSIKQAYEKGLTDKTKDYKDYSVAVKKLDEVLKEYAPSQHIHFMKIDVEGYEYNVLAGNDWSKYRPEMLCIEANHILKDWHSILEKADYELVFDDGLNEYFLRKESAYRKKKFDYAESMILSGIIINPGVAKRIIQGEESRAHLAGVQQRLQHYMQEVSRLERINASLGFFVNNLQLEIDRSRTVRRLVKDLYYVVDNRVMDTIDRRGRMRVVSKKAAGVDLDVKVLKAMTKEQLLRQAKYYDVKSFFQYRAPKDSMKLRYRVIGKAYRTIRDTTLKVAKKGYGLAKRSSV